MKAIALIAVAALMVPTVAAPAPAGNAKSAEANSPPAKKAEGVSHKATGVVKKIDPVAGKVTLAHDPVADLKWPAMTMAFAVKDKKLMDKLAVGKKVDFEFAEQGTGYVVTAVK